MAISTENLALDENGDENGRWRHAMLGDVSLGLP